jgi:hypothetical protein
MLSKKRFGVLIEQEFASHHTRDSVLVGCVLLLLIAGSSTAASSLQAYKRLGEFLNYPLQFVCPHNQNWSFLERNETKAKLRGAAFA